MDTSWLQMCRFLSDSAESNRHILTWQIFDISAPSLTKSHPMELFCLAILAAQIWVSRLQMRRKKNNGCLIMWPDLRLSPKPWHQFYQPKKRFQKRCRWCQRCRKGTRSRYNNQMQQHFNQQLAMAVVAILFCAGVLVFAWPRGTATWEMLVVIATIKHIIALHHLTNVNEFTCTAWTLFRVLCKYFPTLRRQNPRNPKKGTNNLSLGLNMVSSIPEQFFALIQALVPFLSLIVCLYDVCMSSFNSRTLANLRPCFCLTYVVVLQMLALKQQPWLRW